MEIKESLGDLGVDVTKEAAEKILQRFYELLLFLCLFGV